MSDACYRRLRDLGVSVETADAVAPIVAELTPKKRAAFFLWVQGVPFRDIAIELGISKNTAWRVVLSINEKWDKCL